MFLDDFLIRKTKQHTFQQNYRRRTSLLSHEAIYNRRSVCVYTIEQSQQECYSSCKNRFNLCIRDHIYKTK